MAQTEDTKTLDEQIAELQARKAQQQQRAQAQAHLAGATEAEKDEGLIRIVGQAMEARLAECRAAGKAGWHDENVSDEFLQQRLQANAEAGDWLDVAVFAAMLHARQIIKE